MIFLIENKVFGNLFYFVIDEAWNENKVSAHMKKHNIINYSAELKEISKSISESKGAHATTFFDIEYVSVVYFHKWGGTALDYGALQHEIFHCVDNMLRNKGVTLSNDSDETFAYCIGHLTRELYNQIWKEDERKNNDSFKLK